MRIDAFRPAAEFKTHMDTWIERFRTAKTAPGYDKVLIPGDPEREVEEQRRKHGVPLLEVVIKDLQALGDKFSLQL
jgi:LDH2 family malate/lactate/ureidoglycolate dehydrogenase